MIQTRGRAGGSVPARVCGALQYVRNGSSDKPVRQAVSSAIHEEPNHRLGEDMDFAARHGRSRLFGSEPVAVEVVLRSSEDGC
jgi:hypothetical protein